MNSNTVVIHARGDGTTVFAIGNVDVVLVDERGGEKRIGRGVAETMDQNGLAELVTGGKWGAEAS